MDARVEIVSTELIQPSRPTPLGFKHLKPSFLDQISPPGYIPLVFFYRNPSKTLDPKEITHHLKESLSKCLTKYYPLAGKLNPDLSVDCNDSGALFLEAKVHAPFFQALRNAPLPKINQFLPFHPFEVDLEKVFGIYPRDEMLLAVKVSLFECGSFAVGACLLHAVGDVVCSVTFMNAWASVSRGENLVPGPSFDLGRRQFPALGPSFFSNSGNSDDSDQNSNQNPNPPKNVSLRLLFSKETITELKQQATTGSGSVKDPTRVELVTAFIWKHFIKLAKAKNEASKSKTMFLSRHAVNVRTRLRSLNSDPGEYAFGNFTIVAANSYMSSGNEPERTFQDLVSLTSAGLRKIDEDFLIRNIQNDPVGHLKSLDAGEMEEVKRQQGNVIVNDSFNTCWNRFPMYEVDFGWGNPVLVTPAGTPAGCAIVVVMGTKCGEGIEAWVGFREDDVALLDDELLSLATTRIIPAGNIRSLL